MKDLKISLLNSLTSDGLKDISIDALELALDSVLSDGILKDIPFIGNLYKSTQAAKGLSEAIFTKKVFRFLFELKTVPQEEREKFFKKLINDEKYSEKIGEKLIVIIQQFDDMDKPSLLGKLLKQVIECKFTIDEFFRISNVIQRSFLPDLIAIRKSGRIQNYQIQVQEHLINLGLFVAKIDDGIQLARIKDSASLGGKPNLPEPSIDYEISSLGEKVRKFLTEK
jgi:hypothetical protein